MNWKSDWGYKTGTGSGRLSEIHELRYQSLTLNKLEKHSLLKSATYIELFICHVETEIIQDSS